MKIRIGDKIVDAMSNPVGVPVVRATAEEIRNDSGGTDVIVHVPCMKMGAKPQPPGGMQEDPLKQRLTKDFLLTLIMGAERYGWVDTEMFVRFLFELSGRDISNIPMQTEINATETESF